MSPTTFSVDQTPLPQPYTISIPARSHRQRELAVATTTPFLSITRHSMFLALLYSNLILRNSNINMLHIKPQIPQAHLLPPIQRRKVKVAPIIQAIRRRHPILLRLRLNLNTQTRRLSKHKRDIRRRFERVSREFPVGPDFLEQRVVVCGTEVELDRHVWRAVIEADEREERDVMRTARVDEQRAACLGGAGEECGNVEFRVFFADRDSHGCAVYGQKLAAQLTTGLRET
jgi:hypothetical protein